MIESRPSGLVAQVIEIHETLIKTGGIGDFVFPTSRLRIQPDKGELLLSVQHAARSVLFKRHPGRGNPLNLDGTGNVMLIAESFENRPDALIRPGLRARDIFAGLGIFLDEYAQGTIDNSIWTPKNPAQALNQIGHLIETGKLRLEELQEFVDRQVRKNPSPGRPQRPDPAIQPSPAPISRETPHTTAPRVVPTVPTVPAPRSVQSDAATTSRTAEPVKEDEITAANVKDVVSRLLNDPPMTRETDLLLRDYFLYLTKELKKISAEMRFPVAIYNREFLDLEQLRQFVKEDAIGLIKGVVSARGREHLGPLGDYFWKTSKVTNLKEIFALTGQSYQEAYQAINPEEL